MIGARHDITAYLTVLSPLHIGSGDRREADRDGEDAPVAAIARDLNGEPYLPGSSIKGVLRRLYPDPVIFGPDRIRGATEARSGLVLFRNAWLFSLPPDATLHVARATRSAVPEPDARRSSFVAAHVSIDAERGIAGSGRLFHEDMVLPGTRFSLRLAVADRPGLLDRVAEMLGLLAAEGGVSFGAGTRTGDGRLRLDPVSVTVQDEHAGNRLALRVPVAKPAKARWTLTLRSDVPFLIHDPDRMAPPAKGGEAERNNVLRGLQAFDGKGLRLTGTSLMGALRARFRETAGTADAGFEGILFGSTDCRGRLAIRAIRATDAGLVKSTTSVRIDRFSGAPIDNALFATEGQYRTEFVVELDAEDRPAVTDDDAARADAAFARFLDMLKDEVWGGLMLGHATNRGYGWFTVKVEGA